MKSQPEISADPAASTSQTPSDAGPSQTSPSLIGYRHTSSSEESVPPPILKRSDHSDFKCPWTEDGKWPDSRTTEAPTTEGGERSIASRIEKMVSSGFRTNSQSHSSPQNTGETSQAIEEREPRRETNVGSHPMKIDERETKAVEGAGTPPAKSLLQQAEDKRKEERAKRVQTRGWMNKGPWDQDLW